MAKTPEYLHKQTLEHIAKAGLKITIHANKMVVIEPCEQVEKKEIDETPEVSFV